MSTPRVLPVFVVILLLAAPVLGWAQSDRTRSETGRHRPAPAPEPEPSASDARSPVAPAARQGGGWFAGIGGGLKGGSELWHVETLNQAPVAWDSRVPFVSERFNASLDNDLTMGLFVGRHLDERWSVRLDLGTARLDVAAEALQGQQGAVFLYDRFTSTSIGLAAEVRLVRLPSYPYLTAGPVLEILSSAAWDELDQTQLGLRVGLGYLRRIAPEFSLRGEVRYSRTGFDAGDFLPRVQDGSQPAVDFSSADHLNLTSFILAVQMNF